MLNNSKAILTYGLNEKETKDFQATGHNIINISNEMASMKVKDIL